MTTQRRIEKNMLIVQSGELTTVIYQNLIEPKKEPVAQTSSAARSSVRRKPAPLDCTALNIGEHSKAGRPQCIPLKKAD